MRAPREALAGPDTAPTLTDLMAQAIRHHGEARLDLRASLRERMRASALMDGAAFAEAMQSAHRQLWDMA